jgi:prolipoprotein diacylglyceryltransferase
MNGCCAGRQTDSWLGIVLANTAGRRERRYPIQLMEAGWAVVVLLLAVAIRGHLPTGGLFAGVVTVYCVVRIVLQPLRESTDSHRHHVRLAFWRFPVLWGR